MGVRFRKSVKIAPGVKINFGKKSVGLSIGNKGGGMTFNSHSGIHTRASLPGTGLSYSAKLNKKKTKKHSARSQASASAVKKPLAFRIWFIVFELMTVYTTITSIGTNPNAAKGGAILIAILLVYNLFILRKSPKLSGKESATTEITQGKK